MLKYGKNVMAYNIKRASTKKQPRQLEDCQPGATKVQVFEALYIAANTPIKSKSDSKKRS